MKYMKRMLCCALSILMVWGTAACGNERKAEMKGELTVSVYKKEEWLDTAAKLFQDKYPEVTVNIYSLYDPAMAVDIYTDSGVGTSGAVPTGQTREDYLAQLNTKILSGEAEDLIMTSTGLPIERYIYMGVFEDLSGYLENCEEISEETHYMNLFDACRMGDGGLYQFPLSAMPNPIMRFDAQVIQNTGIGPAEGTDKLNWREALNLAKEMYDKSTLENTFMPDMRTTVGNIFTKTAVAGINYETGTVELNREKMLEILQVFVEMENYKIRPDNFDLAKGSHTVFSLAYQPDVELAVDMLFYDSCFACQWESEEGNVYLCPYYATDFGINSASEQKELAWEFLKFLASDEIQTLPSFPMAGVSKKGLEERVSGILKQGADREYSEEEVRRVFEQVERWTLQINAYKQEDAKLISISEEELQQFLEGKTSALETVDNLERKLEQYVNE